MMTAFSPDGALEGAADDDEAADDAGAELAPPLFEELPHAAVPIASTAVKPRPRLFFHMCNYPF
ncbi:hypothetical protein [Cohnella rhizosphaerae]|uniref:hypothetical protein n=1 Tax=Cohnella rhizosphaerae TaxID=1457232 RepID=UPI0030B91494